jgi:hypothetical protein
MANKPVLYPYRRSKGASSNSTSVTHFPPMASLKKPVRSAGKDNSHLSDSAFLADRGCLSPGKLQKRSAA